MEYNSNSNVHSLMENLFFFILGSRQMRRGCVSDNTEDRNECSSINERCILCDGSTCNAQPAVTPSSLSCIQCTNSNTECSWGHDASDARTCSESVIFPNVESCFTFQHDNNAVTRGCTLDNELLCSEGDQSCQRCTGNSCNVQNVVTQTCKVCRSDATGQERCGSDAFDGLEEQCGSVVKYENRGCYSKREGLMFKNLYVNIKLKIRFFFLIPRRCRYSRLCQCFII